MTAENSFTTNRAAETQLTHACEPGLGAMSFSADYTNKHAHQFIEESEEDNWYRRRWEDLDIEEFKAFIGCLIYRYIGVHKSGNKATKSSGQMTMAVQNYEQQRLSTDSKS